MKYTCAIVEDDNISRVIIEGLVEKTDLFRIEGSFSSAQEASHWLNDHEVDLLFLDVEMPGLNGLELFSSLPYKPRVIVISASPNYAAHAFELSFIDYLVKPVKNYPRFLSAINKFIASRKASNNRPEPKDTSLFVKVDSLLLKLKVEDIYWIEAFGDYIKIQTREQLHTVYSTLKKLEDKLSSKNFVRVHRSCMVNVSHITNIDPNNLEVNRKIIPIGGSYREELLKKISVL